MTPLGKLIHDRRKARGWGLGKTAERAQELPGAPDIGAHDVRRWERTRVVMGLEQNNDKLPWILAVLEISAQEVCAALGLDRGKAA